MGGVEQWWGGQPCCCSSPWKQSWVCSYQPHSHLPHPLPHYHISTATPVLCARGCLPFPIRTREASLPQLTNSSRWSADDHTWVECHCPTSSLTATIAAAVAPSDAATFPIIWHQMGPSSAQLLDTFNALISILLFWKAADNRLIAYCIIITFYCIIITVLHYNMLLKISGMGKLGHFGAS